MNMPKLSDYKDIDITDALNQEDDTKFQDTLQTQIDSVSAKYNPKSEYFKKAMLENITMQEIIKPLFLDNNKSDTLDIDPTKQPNKYKFFNQIYNTFLYETKENIMNLREIYKNIQTWKDEIYSKTDLEN